MLFLITKPKLIRDLQHLMHRIILGLSGYIKRKTEENKRQLKIFGILFFINYPIYYFIWVYGSEQSYESMGLRFSASLVCVPLILKNKWPFKLKKYLPIYWYFSAMYCLPFFFIFMTLKNNGSTAWLLNLILALLLIFLLFDFFALCVLSVVGAIFAWGAYFFSSTAPFHFQPGQINLLGALATFLAAFVVGGIFAHNREKIEIDKIDTIKMIATSIAHELRTPLATIGAQTSGIRKLLPKLVKVYRDAKKENLAVPFVNNAQLEGLETCAERIRSEVHASSHFIDMLLVNVRQYPYEHQVEECSIKGCIQEALQRYPFQGEQKNLIHFDGQGDFLFEGNRLLMVHVFFNLIKNALYYVAADANANGQIIVRVETNGSNKVYFEDTGKGIAKGDLPHIFDRFYSRTYHGAGVGLAFCKMVMEELDGKIKCESNEGKLTSFVLDFPNKSR